MRNFIKLLCFHYGTYNLYSFIDKVCSLASTKVTFVISAPCFYNLQPKVSMHLPSPITKVHGTDCNAKRQAWACFFDCNGTVLAECQISCSDNTAHLALMAELWQTYNSLDSYFFGVGVVGLDFFENKMQPDK